MRISLKDIIEISGAFLPFSFEVDTSGLEFEGVRGFSSPVTASGEIRNHAGALCVTGEVRGEMDCVCARCLKEFRRELKSFRMRSLRTLSFSTATMLISAR